MTKRLESLGFIGLGAMGLRMVPHLLKAGHAVHVFDLDTAAVQAMAALGASPCRSAREVADETERVFTCLPTPEIVERVLCGEGGEGAVIAGGRVCIVVDHSTIGPTAARRIASRLAVRDIAFLDAPLAGGVAGAEAATLSVMVSGPREAFDRCAPAFAAVGRKVIHLGEQVGLGQALKLVNNMIVGATLVASAEAMLLGVKCGLDATVLLDVLNASTGRSFTSEHIMARSILTRNFDFGFRMDLMRKDLRLFMQEAEIHGASVPACAVAKQMFDLAMATGRAEEDMSRVVLEVERLSMATLAA